MINPPRNLNVLMTDVDLCESQMRNVTINWEVHKCMVSILDYHLRLEVVAMVNSFARLQACTALNIAV